MIERGLLQLALARGIGEVSIKKIIAFMECNNYSWDDIWLLPSQILSGVGFQDDIIQNVSASRLLAERLSDELFDCGVDILVQNDIDYPQYLKRMLGDKCPPFLFAKGNCALLNKHSVGFCGSRKASEKGLAIAADCAKQLAENSITVISGYASGTDLTSHRAALLNGGSTVFVLPEGILRATLKNEICELLNPENHVFVSQFMPKITWNAGNAMRRNNVIIGLSRAMILVESGKTGGTFAAGEEALKVGCPLFVIDFAQPEVSAEANPYFISSGGQPIRGKNGVPNIAKVIAIANKDVQEKEMTIFDDCKDCFQMKIEI